MVLHILSLRCALPVEETVGRLGIREEQNAMHNDTDESVLVAGAGGFVGSHTARLLVAQERKVRGLRRGSSSTAALKDLDVEIHYGDVLDPASLKPAMAG